MVLYSGRAVSVSGDTIIVGAPGDVDNGSSSGSAYVYHRDNNLWKMPRKFTAIVCECGLRVYSRRSSTIE